MVDTLEDDAPGLLTLQKWAAGFQRSLEDDPTTATTPEVIDRVHQIVRVHDN